MEVGNHQWSFPPRDWTGRRWRRSLCQEESAARCHFPRGGFLGHIKAFVHSGEGSTPMYHLVHIESFDANVHHLVHIESFTLREHSCLLVVHEPALHDVWKCEMCLCYCQLQGIVEWVGVVGYFAVASNLATTAHTSKGDMTGPKKQFPPFLNCGAKKVKLVGDPVCNAQL
ncbi:hypothetical protein BC830DRAFT_512995 [Chytriomyces sp. MP71]|nr:hypothetical protein BC830DRAFT_512995 [Chytriomyces sp. MP71]